MAFLHPLKTSVCIYFINVREIQFKYYTTKSDSAFTKFREERGGTVGRGVEDCESEDKRGQIGVYIVSVKYVEGLN